MWLAAGIPFDQVEPALRERLGAAEDFEIITTREIRMRSLSIFDRTFAVTYGLEVIAVLIGLFGVSVSFSAQVLARRREFGVLRHLGMTRREIGVMLGCEGILVSALGVGFGLALGWLISLILVMSSTGRRFIGAWTCTCRGWRSPHWPARSSLQRVSPR